MTPELFSELSPDITQDSSFVMTPELFSQYFDFPLTPDSMELFSDESTDDGPKRLDRLSKANDTKGSFAMTPELFSELLEITKESPFAVTPELFSQYFDYTFPLTPDRY